VFDLHTDESFKASPCEFVLMHCWRNDPAGGGITLLANSEQAAARLEPWAAALCFRVKFLWRNNYAPILARSRAVQWPLVRFNAREIAGDAIGEDEPDLRARVLPDIFLAAANAAVERVQLKDGDCLVLDNRRVLHGRTAFDPASRRMLKRVWVTKAQGSAAAASGTAAA
jgi:alpha-ketoglutarate-dependent taurine dioxygenase